MRLSDKKLARCIALIGAIVLGAAAAGTGSARADALPRAAALQPGEKIVTGFIVSGMTDHTGHGITAAGMQEELNGIYARLAAGQPARIGDVPVRARVVEGAIAIPEATLRAIAHSVMLRYEQANIAAIAYLPNGYLDGQGAVHITVLEGRFGKVIVQGNGHHYNDATIGAYFKDLQGQPADLALADTATLRANDLPGIKLTTSLQPGEAAGETDLVVNVVDERRFEETLSFDNYGTNTTGTYRIGAAETINDLTGLGDQINLGVVKLFDPYGSLLGNVRFSIPLFNYLPVDTGTPRIANTVGFYAGYSHNSLAVSQQVFGIARLKGYLDREELGIDARLYRTQADDLALRIFADHSRSRVNLYSTVPGVDFEANVVDDTDSTINLATSYRHSDANGLLGGGRMKFQDDLYLALRQGVTSLGDEESFVSSDPATQAEYGPDPKFSMITGSVTHIQGTFKDQALILSGHGQFSQKFLASLEQFSMGGPDTVRAYPVAELLRDEGVAAQVEYRFNAPGFAGAQVPWLPSLTWGQIFSVKLFYDYAKGYDASGRPQATRQGVATLAGAGGGFDLDIPRQGNYFGGAQVDLTVSAPTSSAVPSDQTSKKARVYSSVAFKF